MIIHRRRKAPTQTLAIRRRRIRLLGGRGAIGGKRYLQPLVVVVANASVCQVSLTDVALEVIRCIKI